jgi:omega-amidase
MDMPRHVLVFVLCYISDFVINKMKISVVQPDLVWENKSENFNNLERLLSPLMGKTDLVILPEMFNTGFSMKTDSLSESSEGETFLWMSNISVEGGFGLCGSYMVFVDKNVYNRWVFVSPENERWTYDKRHVFSISGEDKYISKGQQRLVFKFKEFRISPYICYDLRFPVWSRNQHDTDLMIYAANWPTSRKNVWNTLLKARAIENVCFVAGSNRIGTDGAGIHYSGDSMIIDPRGDIISSADSGLEQCITAELSIDELNNFRKKFPVHEDADDFSVQP